MMHTSIPSIRSAATISRPRKVELYQHIFSYASVKTVVQWCVPAISLSRVYTCVRTLLVKEVIHAAYQQVPAHQAAAPRHVFR